MIIRAGDRDRPLRDGEFEEIVGQMEGEGMDTNSDLFMVYKRNPYFRVGTPVYLYNEGFQKVEFAQSGRAPGTAEVRGSRGPLWKIKPMDHSLLVPRKELMPFVIRMPRRIG